MKGGCTQTAAGLMALLAVLGTVVVGTALAGGTAAPGGSFAFMPDGGRGLFLRAFPDPAAQRDALTRTRSPQDWQAALASSGLTPREVATLAAYLSHIAPRPAGEGSGESPAASLPPDGHDLALAQCQSCHSLFSGYLMQRRDRSGWLVVFASPFHKVIPMTQAEREIFADYSALNMPMRIEDVPPEMRF